MDGILVHSPVGALPPESAFDPEVARRPPGCYVLRGISETADFSRPGGAQQDLLPGIAPLDDETPPIAVV